MGYPFDEFGHPTDRRPDDRLFRTLDCNWNHEPVSSDMMVYWQNITLIFKKKITDFYIHRHPLKHHRPPDRWINVIYLTKKI